MTQPRQPLRPLQGLPSQDGKLGLQNQLQTLRRSASSNTGFGGNLPQDQKEPEETSLLLMAFIDIMRKRLWLIILLSIVIGVLVHSWSRSLPKKYSANTIVEVVSGSQKVFTNIRDVVSYHFQLRRFYATQKTILQSNRIAEKALDLVPGVRDSPDFYGLSQLKDKKEILKRMKLMRPHAVNIFKGRISVSSIRKSSLFRVSIIDNSPQRAKQLTEAIAEAYKDYNLQFRLRATQNAYRKIQEQRNKFGKIRDKLNQRLLKFRQNNNVLTTSLTDRRNIAFKQLEALNQRHIEVMLRRIATESRMRSLLANRKRGRYRLRKILDPQNESFPEVLESKLVQDLSQKYNNLLLKKRSFLEKYKPKHQKIVRIQNQLTKLKEIISQQIKLIYSSAFEKLNATYNEEKRLRRLVSIAKGRLQKLEKINLRFDQIKEKLKELDRSLGFLNKRFFEVQLLKDSTATNVRVVEKARVPTAPFAPRVLRNTAVGIILSFMTFMGLFLLFELMDRTVRTFEDVEVKAGVTLLGEVPLIKVPKNQKEEPLYNPDQPLSQIEEAIRSIRTNVLFMSPDLSFRTLLFTSPSPREGKTFVAANLSIGLAHTGRRCVLVDTDMRRPRVHKILGMEYDRSKGISSVLFGQVDLDDAIIETPYPNLWVLPCGPIPPNPTELIQTESFLRVKNELLERFDTVLFDSPPLNVTDAVVLSNYVDGVILISSCGSTTWNALKAAAKSIETVGSRLLGCILNKYDPKHRRGYYKAYSYKYNYKYTEDNDSI